MIGKLDVVVLDAPDISQLAGFYADLAGWKQADADSDWITMRTDDGWKIAFQHAPDHVAPRWPDPAYPQQAHLDLRVPDLAAATQAAQKLGATLAGGGETWNTLIDAAGHPFDLCASPDNPGITLMGVMLDCPDAKHLGTFYSELLGLPVTYESEAAVMIGNEGDRPLLFQQITEFTAPAWPDPARPQQFHLDVQVDDIDQAETAVLALGATRLPGGGSSFRVYADPVGKPFCLVWS